MSAIVAGPDGRQLRVVERDGWWLVEDPRNGDCLSGGFPARGQAIAEARALLEAGR